MWLPKSLHMPRFRMTLAYAGIWSRIPFEGAMPAQSSDLFEIIQTTRSMRRWNPDPVPRDLIRKILEAGVSAPSGGNMQRWRFLVVRDPRVKQTVGAYSKRTWDEVVAPR